MTIHDKLDSLMEKVGTPSEIYVPIYASVWLRINDGAETAYMDIGPLNVVDYNKLEIVGGTITAMAHDGGTITSVSGKQFDISEYDTITIRGLIDAQYPGGSFSANGTFNFRLIK